ncbi:MAG: SDR family NAD(P)-dependent oxidoreductase [Thermaurantimonas sp.]|uniref:SDR family NAD(P)-dependent oxidoreductase n=1 Tax=Thermaurantimonas sp. TaxID=2681568 RepID=UPI00391BF499
MRIEGKVWAVTGAGSGIGLALTREILNRGGRVALIDISGEALNRAKSDFGNTNAVSIHQTDISDFERIKSLPSEILQHHGQMDGLVNNAGIIQPFVDFTDLTDDKILKILNVNLLSVVYLLRIFYPHLKDRPEAHIANVSSMGGIFPFPGQSWYGATKAAVKLLTEAMYAELMNSNIRMTLIIPGAVRTNIMENSGIKQPVNSTSKGRNILSAEKAAFKICNAIEKNTFRLLLGNDARFLDLFYRLMPERSIGIIARQMKKMLAANQ